VQVQPHVEIRGISKHFGGVTALKNIHLTIERGTVHGLVGENGAGKSTLGKIISGIIRPDPDGGEILVNNRPVHYTSPHAALLDGITMISQEVALAPRLNVLKNVYLGIESRRGGFLVDNKATCRRFDDLLAKSGFGLPADAPVLSLNFSELKQVEILKAMARNAKLIVMDEPTAALPDDEADRLLEIIRQLRTDGATIIFVSHFLEEVLSVADTVSVLRDGELIQTTPASGQTPDTLVMAMLGRAMSLTFPPKHYPKPDAPAVFSVKNLSKRGSFEDISFNIQAGEIVGLAGLVGSGRSAVARTIFGAERRDKGEVEVDGIPVKVESPADAIKTGIALLPESRKTHGLLMNFTLAPNITLPHLNTVSKGPVIQNKHELDETGQLLRQLDVRPPQPQARVNNLSGGNQQKVLFGKWLFRPPRLLIADEPTHGVDVGAKRAIYQLITQLAAQGMSILVISSELEEILGLAHRVLVMRQGRLVAEFKENPAENLLLSEDAIMHAAFATR
jgi:simple sugar transport system ATP-binding protein/ribose transport system ATP-binding protein